MCKCVCVYSYLHDQLTYQQMHRLFPYLIYCVQCCDEDEHPSTLWYANFIFLGQTSGSRIIISYASFFYFLRHLCTIFHNGYTSFIPSNCAQKSLCLRILAGIWYLGIWGLATCTDVLWFSPRCSGSCSAQHYLLGAWLLLPSGPKGQVDWHMGQGTDQWEMQTQFVLLENKKHPWEGSHYSDTPVPGGRTQSVWPLL